MPGPTSLTAEQAMPIPRPASPTASAEQEWVAAARGGDPRAFALLVSRHERRVFRLVGRFFRRREDVDDLAQETFLRAWGKLVSYRGDAPFEHWLTRLCLNLCYQTLRRKRPHEVGLESVGEMAARRDDPDAAIDAERLLARLDPRDRFVLLLLDGEGWSTSEIAQRLGWTRVNVKVRAHRARKKLRRLVEEELKS